MVSSKKKWLTAWGLPDLHYILPYIIAFHRDNDLDKNKIEGKKVDILTKEANAKKTFGIKAKKNSVWKRPIFGVTL